MSESQHLVQMVNDIGNFFRAQPNREDAIAGIVNHLKNFWTRRMREKLVEQLSHGDSGLDELPREAVRQLLKNTEPKATPPPGGDAG
jgi:formate dehydrogenase subunit delta